MAECTGAFGHTRRVVPAALGDDLVCFTCGSKIAPLLVFGDDGVDEAAGVSESLPGTVTPPPPPPPPRQPPVAKQEKATARRPTPKPGLTHFKEVRRLVRVEMLARIPGMNRAKAGAVVARLPNRTMSAIVSLPTGELAAIPVGTSGSLGPDLAQALKKVVS